MTLYAVPDDDNTPYPVNYQRVVSTLNDMKYQVDEIVPERAAGGVFDNVPFLFTFDSTERFMSIRALWETPLDAGTHAAQMFTITDEWNREKYFPTAYWIPTDDGTIQFCADFVIDTQAGLSNTQLRENLGSGIATGLGAVEYAKQGVCACLGMPANLATSPSEGAAFGL